MNRIKATIAALETQGSITLVHLQTPSEITLQLLLIDTPETVSYLKKGNTVTALFKETEVILARLTTDAVVIPNKIPAKIRQLEQEQFLTRVHLETAVGPLAALVHSRTLQSMGFNKGDELNALIKMNEIMLVP